MKTMNSKAFLFLGLLLASAFVLSWAAEVEEATGVNKGGHEVKESEQPNEIEPNHHHGGGGFGGCGGGPGGYGGRGGGGHGGYGGRGGGGPGGYGGGGGGRGCGRGCGGGGGGDSETMVKSEGEAAKP